MLTRIAGNLPQRHDGAAPSSVTTGGGRYSTSIPLRSAADEWSAKTTFLRWVWYAARRADLHLDEAWDEFSTPDLVATSLRIVAPTLRLSVEEQKALAPKVRIVRYGAGETLQYPGQVPKRMMFVVNGQVRLTAVTDDGQVLAVRTLSEGDFLGQTTLTREPVTAGGHAVDEVTVLIIERLQLEQLVEDKPELLHDIGRAIDDRKQEVRRTLASAVD